MMKIHEPFHILRIFRRWWNVPDNNLSIYLVRDHNNRIQGGPKTDTATILTVLSLLQTKIYGA